MGTGRWDADQWSDHQSSVSSKTVSQIYTQSGGAIDELNPKNIKVRESVDSSKNPESTPIMIFVDNTGSMGKLSEIIIKESLGKIMKEIYDRKPISDPHIACGAVGDAYSDNYPLQVTQFEAEVGPITEQVMKIYIEGNGGGNNGESYILSWWFAAHKTQCDAIRKRNRKGYIFTIGDEAPHKVLTRDQIQSVFNENVEADITINDLLELVYQNWEVFHLITPTSSTNIQNAQKTWRDILGERAIEVSDHEKLAEVIVSTIQVIEGEDAKKVADSWDGSTSLVVQKAVGHLSKRQKADGNLVRMS